MLRRNKFNELQAYTIGFGIGVLFYVAFWIGVIATIVHFVHKYW